MFAPLKEITEKMRQSTISKSRINPIVMSNGEILSGLIGNATDNEMEF